MSVYVLFVHSSAHHFIFKLRAPAITHTHSLIYTHTHALMYTHTHTQTQTSKLGKLAPRASWAFATSSSSSLECCVEPSSICYQVPVDCVSPSQDITISSSHHHHHHPCRIKKVAFERSLSSIVIEIPFENC